jgi:CubicO group peptidase (beta-lactamase class C family)
LIDPGLTADADFPYADADPKRIDVSALRALADDVGANQTDAFIVIQDGAIIAERYYKTQPHAQSIQSVTKSISSLAVGFLMDAGAIQSLDTPLSTYFPEWATGDKASATIRHVLTMSTGIVDDPNGDFWNQPDLLAYARAQPLAAPPGQLFAYSDLAVELLAGVVSKAAGENIDVYLQKRLFAPLGIKTWQWFPDSSGKPQTSGGLYMLPRDLSRIGWLMLGRGKWKDNQLFSASWVSQSETPSAANGCYGLLWWLVRPGCDNGSLVAPDPASLGEQSGFNALGYGGQYIVMNPKANLIAVRTLQVDESFVPTEANFIVDFPSRVEALSVQ